MEKLKLFCNIKIKENLNKDDPSDKILLFSISTPEAKTITFSNECFLNYTSNRSGIIEVSPKQVNSFKYVIEDGQAAILNNSHQGKIGVSTFKDLPSKMEPENFLFYDDKKLVFLLSQVYIEGFIDSTGNYITLDMGAAKNFFENIRQVLPDILKTTLPNLSLDDTIEIIAN